MTDGADTSPKWHHGKAALTTFLATPVIGLSQIFLADAVASGRSFWAEVYQATAWLMVFSVLVSWLILPLLLPITEIAARRFGPAFWLAMPTGAMIGVIVSLLLYGPMMGAFTVASAVTGAMMAAIYCGTLRWFGPD